MDLFVKVRELTYTNGSSDNIYYAVSARTSAGHSGDYDGYITVNGGTTPAGINAAIVAAAEVGIETDHSITIGILDRRFVYGLSYQALV